MSFPYSHPFLGLSNGLNTKQGGVAGAVGGWVELGRTTLGSAGDTISVSSLSDKRYYMILQSELASGSVYGAGRFNSDSGSNYSARYNTNGASESTLTSHSNLVNYPTPVSGAHNFNVNFVSNLSSKEKLVICHAMGQNTVGAANAPSRRECVGKWANTSNAINAYSANNLSSGDFASGSEVVVLGWDPADTHTNNFWEELASVDLSGGAADYIDSGTFTAKKYLWIQCFTSATGGNNDHKFTVNGDTGSNYAKRTSTNGGADGTNASQANLDLTGTHNVSNFTNMFVINNSSNEKLFIVHTITINTAGAGTAPDARTETVGKWANTSNQITSCRFTNAAARTGQYDTNSILKVWGAN